MSEREELEAVIAGAIEDLPMRDCADQGGELDRLRVREAIRAVATALLSSGYTKGDGELVEAARVWVEAAIQDYGDPTEYSGAVAAGFDGDSATTFEMIGRARKALSDSEVVAPSGRSGGDDWQPIETAPKDADWVLIFDAVPACDEYNSCMVARYRNGDWCGEGASSSGVVRNAVARASNPTHWMPLPTPPAQDTQRAERATNGGRDDG